MIPAGRTPANSARAAALLGVSLGHFDNARLWRTLPAPLSRPDAAVRIWDEAQLHAAVAGLPIPELPATAHPDDLLDTEETRLALPEPRPTAKTWSSYLSKGRVPPADAVVFGVEHRRRSTIETFAAERRTRRGRPPGSTDTAPRTRTGQRFERAEQRAARTRELLRASPDLTADQLAAALGVTARHAQRLLTAARG